MTEPIQRSSYVRIYVRHLPDPVTLHYVDYDTAFKWVSKLLAYEQTSTLHIYDDHKTHNIIRREDILSIRITDSRTRNGFSRVMRGVGTTL